MQVDGNDYGSRSVTKSLARHKLSSKHASDKAASPDMPSENSGHSMHDHAGEAGGHEEIQKVAAEHGPAQKGEMKHDGEHHSVTTTHEDGHVHESKGHPSLAHAHEHIGHSMGNEGEPEMSGGGSDGGASLEGMGIS